MSEFKRVAATWCPPALKPFALKVWSVASGRGLPRETGLAGRYPSWNAAVAAATGYSTATILDAMTSAADTAARSNGLQFDRDGHVFDTPITPFPLLSCLLKAAKAERLRVVDFGGALGATYRQCHPFLSQIGDLHWNVVEQPAMVRIGIDRFQNDQLCFFETLAQAADQGPPDVVIFSGVLQYLDDPYAVIRDAVSLAPAMIVIDRNPFSWHSDDIFTTQLVPAHLFSARLPFRVFGDAAVERVLSSRYRKLAQFDTVDPDMRVESIPVHFLGQAFERVEGRG